MNPASSLSTNAPSNPASSSSSHVPPTNQRLVEIAKLNLAALENKTPKPVRQRQGRLMVDPSTVTSEWLLPDSTGIVHCRHCPYVPQANAAIHRHEVRLLKKHYNQCHGIVFSLASNEVYGWLEGEDEWSRKPKSELALFAFYCRTRQCKDQISKCRSLAVLQYTELEEQWTKWEQWKSEHPWLYSQTPESYALISSEACKLDLGSLERLLQTQHIQQSYAESGLYLPRIVLSWRHLVLWKARHHLKKKSHTMDTQLKQWTTAIGRCDALILKLWDQCHSEHPSTWYERAMNALAPGRIFIHPDKVTSLPYANELPPVWWKAVSWLSGAFISLWKNRMDKDQVSQTMSEWDFPAKCFISKFRDQITEQKGLLLQEGPPQPMTPRGSTMETHAHEAEKECQKQLFTQFQQLIADECEQLQTMKSKELERSHRTCKEPGSAGDSMQLSNAKRQHHNNRRYSEVSLKGKGHGGQPILIADDDD